jgi:hypothetical protein
MYPTISRRIAFPDDHCITRLKNFNLFMTGRATALSLPIITALDQGTMVGKPKAERLLQYLTLGMSGIKSMPDLKCYNA